MFSQIHQEKRERTQINKVRNERREIITNVTEIKKHERILCITIKHKAINWTTQKKWINFQRHTIFQTESGTNRQSEIDKLKKKKLLASKNPGLDSFTGEFYQYRIYIEKS